jgi:TonB-linked SusC/RagA family outer membrane protein
MHLPFKLLFMKIVCLKLGILLACFFISSAAWSQARRITGRVVSEEDNKPLAGVNIMVKGKTTGTQSDAAGTFSIEASDADVLVLSYTGFATQEIAVGNAASMDVTLKLDAAKLSEVVVIGYGTQSRRNVTGSVASVDKKVLQSVPRTNLATALQGTAPGLRVQQTSGQPGTTPTIVLRGGTNFDGSGSPLFVVDGVIVPTLFGLNYDDVESIDVLKDAASLAIYGARAGNGVILITTKKGKKGKTQVSYSFRRATNYVRRNPVDFLSAEDYIHWNRLGLANRYQLGKLAGDADTTATKGQITGAWGFGTNSGWTAPDGKYSTQLVSNANRQLLNDPKWHLLVDKNPFNPNISDSLLFRSISQKELEDLILQQSNLQEHYVNFSGANDMGAFALGLGTIKDIGMVTGSSLKRLNMNFNGGLNVNKDLKITTNISAYSHRSTPSYLTADNSGGLTGGLIQRFGGIAPTVRLTHDVTGAILPGVDGGTLGNPLYLSDKFINRSQEQRFAGSLNLEYQIWKGLKFLASASGFIRYTTDESFTKLFQAGTGGAINSTRPASIGNNRTFQYSYNGFLQYSKTIKKHAFDVMGGGEYFDRKNYADGATVTGAATDFISYLVAGTTASGVPFSTFNSWNRFASVIARANYSYDRRFLFTINTRYDGTSQLSDHYGFFPGISAGWNLHREAFFNHSFFSRVLSTAKPRVSWGQNGTLGPLGDFSTIPQYNNAGIYNGLGGFVAGNLANPDLKWEKTTTLNFGLDLGFLNDRVSLIADYFIRDVFDKIQNPSVPAWTGFTSYTLNLARLQNKGVELEVKANVIRPKSNNGFNLDLSANFFHVKSYVKKLLPNGLEKNRQGAIQVYDPKSRSYVWVAGLQEGVRVGSDEIWAPIFDGIYRTPEDLSAKANLYTSFLPYTNKKAKQLGDARWRDVDGNDTIDSRDYVFVGRTTPTAQGGFSALASFKGFSLFAQFDYSLGFMIANQSWLRGMSQVQGSQNGPVDVKDSWTPENPNAKYPRYYWANYGRNYFTDAGGNTTAPANYWQKGDYLAMREVTLTYELPQSILSNLLKNRINGIRAYVSGSNLVYFTKYNGTFPEVGGNDVGRFPLPKTVTLGLTVNL